MYQYQSDQYVFSLGIDHRKSCNKSVKYWYENKQSLFISQISFADWRA